MSSLGSAGEEDSEVGSWSSDDDIPLALSDHNVNCSNFLLLEDIVSEVIVDIGHKVTYSAEFQRHVSLNFDLDALPTPLRQALGLGNTEMLTITLKFDSNKFGAGQPPQCAVTCSKALSAYGPQRAPPCNPEQPVPDLPPSAALCSEPQTPGQEYADEDKLAEDVEEADSASESSDSTSPNVPEVTTALQFQLGQIACRIVAANWPQAQSAKFSQAKNWIINLHQYLASRLLHAGDVCVSCDEPQPVAGPKPVACSKAMCIYQVDELGYGASMAAIYQEPMVADLLISLAAQAASHPNHKHKQRFFACPYPPSDFVCASKRTANANDPDDNMGIQWDELQLILSGLPSVASMAAAKHFKRFLDKHHPKAYRLVRWVLSTCRVHIVQLQPQEEIARMGGTQFKMFTNTFDRETAFQKLKRAHGSSYAFHGSRFMNWHSILRTSLQNFSNTQYMLNGATYGSGVYLSPHASTSSGYCRSTGLAGDDAASYKNSVFGKAPSCLALTEVANTPTSTGSTASGSIRVVKDHDAVVARYLFVYSGEAVLQAVSTDQLQIPRWEDSSTVPDSTPGLSQ